MIQPIQKTLLERLAEICELSEDVRFGQLLDFLGLLASAHSGQSLAEIEDNDLVRIMERHRDQLKTRQPVNVTADGDCPDCVVPLARTE